MWKIFKNHPEAAVVFMTVILLALLAVSLFWGITAVVVALNRAASAGGEAGPAANFDFKGAQGLDLKGLVK